MVCFPSNKNSFKVSNKKVFATRPVLGKFNHGSDISREAKNLDIEPSAPPLVIQSRLYPWIFDSKASLNISESIYGVC
jgi:hypothetical protein